MRFSIGRGRRVLVAAGALLAIAAAAMGGAKAAPASGDAAHGREVYVAVGCYECHGYAGQGGAAGPHIAALPWPDERFNAFIRHPAREMPPYTAKVLSDADVAAIHAYLRSLPSPPAAPGAPAAPR